MRWRAAMPQICFKWVKFHRQRCEFVQLLQETAAGVDLSDGTDETS